MPYVKKPEQPFAKMTRLLRGYGLTATEMSRLLGCSYPTGQKRLNQPESLTLAELDRISRAAHIPIEEIREAIQR